MRGRSLAAALALGLSVLTAAATEPVCAHAGDRNLCTDGREFPIVDAEPDAPRPGPGRARGGKPRSFEVFSPRGRPAADIDGQIVIGPDGRVCRPHGDHFHCR